MPVKFALASSILQKTSDTTQTTSSKTPSDKSDQPTDHNQNARNGDSSDEDDVPLAVAKRAAVGERAAVAKRGVKRKKAALPDGEDNIPLARLVRQIP